MEHKVFRKNLSSSSGILCNRSFSSEDRVSQMTKTTATVTFHGQDRGAVVLKSRQPHGGHYQWIKANGVVFVRLPVIRDHVFVLLLHYNFRRRCRESRNCRYCLRCSTLGLDPYHHHHRHLHHPMHLHCHCY